MKRSEINESILLARDFFKAFRFMLPKWAFWGVQNWEHSGAEMRGIKECRLGWDVTDFGLGRFRDQGLILFTLRNGVVHVARDETRKESSLSFSQPMAPRWVDSVGVSYSEKIMLVRAGQTCPQLRLRDRARDLINRGGGDLVLQVHNAATDDSVDEAKRVPIRINGIAYNIKPGGVVRLVPGDAITLASRVYHKFWAEKSSCLLGEVSTTCDDERDYLFLDPATRRFPEIEEDATPAHLLCYEYPDFE